MALRNSHKIALLAALTLAQFVIPASAESKTYIISNSIPACTDCSLPEAAKPASVFYLVKSDAGMNVVISADDLQWKRWGSGSASASKSGIITDCASCDNGAHLVNLKFVAYRRARHTRDGCGHTRSDRIYTRLKVTVTGPAESEYLRSWVIKLPKTGCETV